MKTTKRVRIKNLSIGGGEPIAIQSMTTTKTSDISATLQQIVCLQEMGCDIVRLAIKDVADEKAVKTLVEKTQIPLVADIHFDHRLAIGCMENGIAKVRINPGNIGSEQNVQALVDCAKMHRVPIRIGVNGGSLQEDIKKQMGVCAEALAKSALYHAGLLEKFGFYEIVLSVKSSDVAMTMQAYEQLSQLSAYPLHLGVTEAGTYENSLLKSGIALGGLLLRGIGDTIRVSITGDPTQEIVAAKKILRAIGKRKDFVEVISCPTCGRCEVNIERIAREIEEKTRHIEKPLKVAIMGCIVNGIGEGECADIGLAGGKGSGALFSKGKILKTVKEEDMVKELLSLIEKETK